ncbi:hypothetical protein BDZ89DRAFT_1136976 [Hymenopellis radicata]|nr:hypothetical protein BDZ89DRAFT_1136976 [Hymenopellis radicata]
MARMLFWMLHASLYAVQLAVSATIAQSMIAPLFTELGIVREPPSVFASQTLDVCIRLEEVKHPS